MTEGAMLAMRMVLAIGILAAGCDSRPVSDAGAGDGGDPNIGALYADVQYATRCETTLGCAGVQDHDVCGFDQGDPCVEGTAAPNLSCEIVEDGTRTISFSAQQGSGSRVAVSGLVVPGNGGSPFGSACIVTVDEGADFYEGACGALAPSEAQPCQITDVVFSDDAGNPTFEARLFCQFLENLANPALQIEVTTIGSGAGAAGTPARIRFANCEGLTCTADTCVSVPAP